MHHNEGIVVIGPFALIARKIRNGCEDEVQPCVLALTQFIFILQFAKENDRLTRRPISKLEK
jgi:hypothetical protein